jgi:hypothetical protein
MRESSAKRILVASHYRAKKMLCRAVPASKKMQPSFMIIGAQKAGTTSMFDYLTGHPQVLKPWFKETDFFSRRRMFSSLTQYTLAQYLVLFPLKWSAARHTARLGKPVITGEASQYLSYPEVPERIRKMLPDTKFIVLLRDPVDRAYSHYSMRKRYGWEKQSFEEAFHRENVEMGMSETSSYKYRGLYATHLERWFESFPRDRFLIIECNEIWADKNRAYDRICDFLGIDHFHPASSIRSNLGGYQNPEPGDLELWRDFFRPHNRRLNELLQTDLGWD